MTRVVCDTNVVVSGLLWAGPPREVLRLAERRAIRLFTSRPLLLELGRVLSYPRLARVLERANLTGADLAAWLIEHASLVVPRPLAEPAIPDDPADEQVLACAIESGADAIISGDRHLLALGVHGGIPILTVRDFLSRTAH
jgi:putative PIN family toxin of toxin-antitoxin system